MSHRPYPSPERARRNIARRQLARDLHSLGTTELFQPLRDAIATISAPLPPARPPVVASPAARAGLARLMKDLRPHPADDRNRAEP